MTEPEVVHIEVGEDRLEQRLEALRWSRRRWQFSLKAPFLTTLICAAYLAGSAMQRQRAVELAAQGRVYWAQRQLARLIDDLKVPAEAYFWDAATSDRICQLRQEEFYRHGILRFHSDGTLDIFRRAYTHRTDIKFNENTCATKHFSADSMGEYLFEKAFHAAGLLPGHLRGDSSQDEVAEYLQEHPDVFVREIRPLLLRLLDARCGYNADSRRVQVCDALLAGGDRSEAVLRTLGPILQSPNTKLRKQAFRGAAATVVWDPTVVWYHGSAKNLAIELNETYRLGLPVSEMPGPDGAPAPYP